MPKRLMLYQIDHIKCRFRQMLNVKIDAINQERDEALRILPEPDYFSPIDAAKAFNRGDFNLPTKGLKQTGSSYGYYGEVKPFCDQCSLDIMALSGYANKNQKLYDAYKKKCERASVTFNKRIEKAKRASETLITKLVLSGAEEYEKAIETFQTKSF